MKCLIVDDNKMARMALKQLVGQVPNLELVAECNDATEALGYLNTTQIDLLFTRYRKCPICRDWN